MEHEILLNVIATAIRQAGDSSEDRTVAAVGAATAFRAGLAAASAEPASHVAPVSNSDYVGDNYPREGCRILIDIGNGRWSMNVFAPGDRASLAHAPIESYASRPFGSTGLAIEAFLHRPGGVRSALSEMAGAERSFASPAGLGDSYGEQPVADHQDVPAPTIYDWQAKLASQAICDLLGESPAVIADLPVIAVELIGALTAVNARTAGG